MLDRLPKECVLEVLRLVSLATLSSVASVCKAWSGDGLGVEVWRGLCDLLVALPVEVTTQQQQPPFVVVSQKKRSRRVKKESARIEFGRLCSLRRSNVEEVLARYDERSKPSAKFLRALLRDKWPVDVNYGGSVGETLLHAVVADIRLSKAQTLQCAKELVDIWRADPTVANDRDFAPLMSAAALGDKKVVRYLLDKGADLEAKGAHPNGFVGAPVRPGQRPRNARDWAEAYGHTDVIHVIDAFLDNRRTANLEEGHLKADLAPPPSSSVEKKKKKISSHAEEVSDLMPLKRRRRKMRYCLPECRLGGENAGEMVACDVCGTWYHIDCLGISLADFKHLVRNDDQFLCDLCKTTTAEKAQPLSLHHNSIIAPHDTTLPPPPANPLPPSLIFDDDLGGVFGI